MNETIDYQRLKEVVSYSADVGVFFWRESKGAAKAGTIAGWVNGDGYISVCIDSKTYQAHRLAWLYMTGEFPRNYIDHKNNIKTDNRLSNLRICTQMQNTHNASLAITNSSGEKGVSWYSKRNMWRVSINFNKKQYTKCFKDFDDAALYARNLRIFLHSDFANNG